MFEGRYPSEILIRAKTSTIHYENGRTLRNPRPDRRGPLWDAIARLGSTLIRLGTSMESLALTEDKIHIDASVHS
jgi:hypothetical protein